MPIPEDVQVLIPWRPLASGECQAQLLSARLEDNLQSSHRLYGMSVRALAIRVDRDDVLFEIEGGERALAVVHMTWQKESDATWPKTKFFQNWEDWSRNEMLPSYKEYTQE